MFLFSRRQDIPGRRHVCCEVVALLIESLEDCGEVFYVVRFRTSDCHSLEYINHRHVAFSCASDIVVRSRVEHRLELRSYVGHIRLRIVAPLIQGSEITVARGVQRFLVGN